MTMKSRIHLGAVVGGMVLALAACAPVEPSAPSYSRPPVPEIVGDTVSSSPLEDDAWVIAARRALLGTALASNLADFSMPEYVETRTSDAARNGYLDYIHDLDNGVEVSLYLGPGVLLPMRVDVADDAASATVSFCNATTPEWSGAPEALARGGRYDVRMVRSEDARLLQEVVDATRVESCDATGAPVALFSLTPAPPIGLEPTDVIPPPAYADDPTRLPAALDRVVTLQGIADGAGIGSELGVAERSDAELRETIEAVTGGVESLIGFIDIPGGWFVGGSVGLVTGAGIDAWADSWYSNDQSYPDAAARATKLEELGEAGLPGRLASMIYAQCGESLGLTPPPPSQAGTSAYDTWVANTLDGIAENYGANSGHIIDGYEQAFSAGSGEARG